MSWVADVCSYVGWVLFVMSCRRLFLCRLGVICHELQTSVLMSAGCYLSWVADVCSHVGWVLFVMSCRRLFLCRLGVICLAWCISTIPEWNSNWIWIEKSTICIIIYNVICIYTCTCISHGTTCTLAPYIIRSTSTNKIQSTVGWYLQSAFNHQMLQYFKVNLSEWSTSCTVTDWCILHINHT